jgi:hypothetical protein
MISESEWESISNLFNRLMRKKGEYFVTGKVIKRDVAKKLVWLQEFGDQAIPIVGFDYEVTYYDETPRGVVTTAVGAGADYTTQQKKAKVKLLVPRVGQSVVVAREFGTRRLPRCIGVIQGTGWISASED